MEVILLVAISANGLIARHSKETITWSQDLALFKSLTLGYPVILGYNTNQTLTRTLTGRRVIVIDRSSDPALILKNIDTSRCFIAGGASTYTLFADYLTQVFVTIHPNIFSTGLPVFNVLNKEIKMTLVEYVQASRTSSISQLRYKVEKR